MNIRRNDIVQVMAGDERSTREKAVRGKVLRVEDDGRVVVEGVNFVWKHLRRSQQHPHGARIQKEAAMDASNLMLVCPSCDKPAKVAHQRLETGERVRICKKCRQAIATRT
ncbi:MAG: 50S ribosomal protein L24 [Planctomycetes bacterium]|nr:50S ribosomal protein L24 [Planctomycetota bacterium]